MAVYAIWESHFPADDAAAGQEITRLIWEDMRHRVGYVGHEILVDADDPGHLVVIGRWASRAHADSTLAAYADHPNRMEVDRLVDRPRRRLVATQMHRG